MILAFVGTKGGVCKTTLATCCAYSRAFNRAFNRVGLVELDPQGSISAWRAQRPDDPTPFFHLDERSAASGLKAATKECDGLVLDVPGESVGAFATRLAAGLADVCVCPLRSSTFDEQSFVGHLWPVLVEASAYIVVLPVFVHPAANENNVLAYWKAVLPDGVDVLPSCFRTRGLFENYNRGGATLAEYAETVKGNARLWSQARKAVDNAECITKEILKCRPREK